MHLTNSGAAEGILWPPFLLSLFAAGYQVVQSACIGSRKLFYPSDGINFRSEASSRVNNRFDALYDTVERLIDVRPRLNWNSALRQGAELAEFCLFPVATANHDGNDHGLARFVPLQCNCHFVTVAAYEVRTDKQQDDVSTVQFLPLGSLPLLPGQDLRGTPVSDSTGSSQRTYMKLEFLTQFGVGRCIRNENLHRTARPLGLPVSMLFGVITLWGTGGAATPRSAGRRRSSSFLTFRNAFLLQNSCPNFVDTIHGPRQVSSHTRRVERSHNVATKRVHKEELLYFWSQNQSKIVARSRPGDPSLSRDIGNHSKLLFTPSGLLEDGAPRRKTLVGGKGHNQRQQVGVHEPDAAALALPNPNHPLVDQTTVDLIVPRLRPPEVPTQRDISDRTAVGRYPCEEGLFVIVQHRVAHDRAPLRWRGRTWAYARPAPSSRGTRSEEPSCRGRRRAAFEQPRSNQGKPHNSPMKLTGTVAVQRVPRLRCSLTVPGGHAPVQRQRRSGMYHRQFAGR